MPKKDVLTTGQVAQLCNVAPRTVTKWFDSGQLRGYRIPGSKDRRIPLNELVRFMKDHNMPTTVLEKGKVRVLIIDSRTDYSSRLAGHIQNRGSFEVKCVNNSFAAGAMVFRFSPNIILIDLMSSQIDAQGLCRCVQDCEDLKDCKLIALAAGLSPREAQNLKAQGFEAVVTDPENMDAILNRIQDYCDVFS